MPFISTTLQTSAYDVEPSLPIWLGIDTAAGVKLWESKYGTDVYATADLGRTIVEKESGTGTFASTGYLYNTFPVMSDGTDYLWYDSTQWIISGMAGSATGTETYNAQATTDQYIYNLAAEATQTETITVTYRDELSWTVDNGSVTNSVFTPGIGETDTALASGEWELTVTGAGGCGVDKAVLRVHWGEYEGDDWYEGPSANPNPEGEYTPRGSNRGKVEGETTGDSRWIIWEISGKIRNDSTGSTSPWGEYVTYSRTATIESNGAITPNETQGTTKTVIGDPIYDAEDNITGYGNQGRKDPTYVFEIAQWLNS